MTRLVLGTCKLAEDNDDDNDDQ